MTSVLNVELTDNVYNLYANKTKPNRNVNTLFRYAYFNTPTHTYTPTDMYKILCKPHDGIRGTQTETLGGTQDKAHVNCCRQMFMHA